MSTDQIKLIPSSAYSYVIVTVIGGQMGTTHTLHESVTLTPSVPVAKTLSESITLTPALIPSQTITETVGVKVA